MHDCHVVTAPARFYLQNEHKYRGLAQFQEKRKKNSESIFSEAEGLLQLRAENGDTKGTLERRKPTMLARAILTKINPPKTRAKCLPRTVQYRYCADLAGSSTTLYNPAPVVSIRTASAHRGHLRPRRLSVELIRQDTLYSRRCSILKPHSTHIEYPRQAASH